MREGDFFSTIISPSLLPESPSPMREGDFFSTIISPSLLGEGFRERFISR